MIGTIQPGPLGLYLNQAIRGGTGDDGLMQRFQLAVWPDDPGSWQVVDRWPDQSACDTAFEVFRRFDELQASVLGASPDPFSDNIVPFLRFREDAQHRFFEWMTMRENYLRSGQEHPALESHLTKYRKLIPALALIIHLAEGNEGSVGLAALDCAIGWGDYLESHARRIYSCGIDPAVGHARALAKRLLAGDVKEDPFTVRDVCRHHWSMLGDKEQVRMGTELLAELGWLSEETTQPKGRGRPTTRYRVNPRIQGLAI
jgi:putative DNA primase/helicase